MTEILLERVSIKGRNWVRTHATDTEGFALCSKAIHEEIEAVELGEGKVTCPDCIEIIKKCKGIPDADQQPEYDNELFWKR
ncbi:hypothetical protein ACJJIK_13625 [Microbulbifer sp. ZKSA006]|uniref:hypothetical protein n=1 Tax=Microbulbifer sp. ZKSA006 TaxID=3243390 RepID=UPI0040394324